MNDIEQIQPVELVSNDALGSITRAEIDVQIATARKYGRELSKVKSAMLTFATLDEETAQGCFYTLPARKGGDGKALQGPSVRMAEIAIACYQHIRAAARIISDDGSFITAQSVVHDLYNNVAVCIDVKRRVTNKDGKRYSDDMIAVTGNAACSIALRNAVFKVVPRALITPVYEAAKKVAVGDVKSLASKRAAVVDRLKQMGAPLERILATVEAAKVEDIDLAKLELLIGLGTALKDGTTTLEEAFPDKTQEGPKRTRGQKYDPPTVDTQETSTKTHQGQLAVIVPDAGFTLDELNVYLLREHETKAEFGSYFDIPDALAEKLVKNAKGLVHALEQIGGAK